MSRPRLVFDHGDYRSYRQGCRCAPCRQGFALYTGTGRVRPDELRVTCWCEATIVEVPMADVAKGITRHCGLAACRRIADQHRRAS